MKEECWVSDVKPQEPSGPSALDSNLEPMLFCTARVGKSQNFKCQSLLPRRKRLKMRAISEDHLEAWELLPDSRPPVPTCAPLMEGWATALKDLLILQHAFILQQRISGCNITKRRSQGPNTRLDFINAIHSPSGKPEMCSELWDCLQYCINGSGLSSDFFLMLESSKLFQSTEEILTASSALWDSERESNPSISPDRRMSSVWVINTWWLSAPDVR